MKINQLIYLLFVLINIESTCVAQVDSTFHYFNRTTPEDEIIDKIKKTKSQKLKNYYNLIYFSKLRNQDSINSYIHVIGNAESYSLKRRSRILYFKGYYNRLIDNDSLAFIYNTKSLDLSRKSQDTLTILYSLAALSQFYDSNDKKSYLIDYLDQLEIAAKKYKSNTFLIIQKMLLGNYYLFREQNNLSAETYNKVLSYNFSSKDSIYLISTLNNLGSLYNENLKNSDSAIYFYKKKLRILNENRKLQNTDAYFQTYSNLGAAYAYKEDFQHSKSYFLKADSLPIHENIIWNKAHIAENLANLNAKTNNYKDAYFHIKKFIIYSDSLNEKEQNISITEIKEKYDNEKLRADNLESEAKRRQNQTIAIGLGGGIIVLSILALLLYKNTKRKQRIAEQEREIEIQKTEKLLKDQELTTIDAMIEGQEKERQRLASDLHDSVGATLSAARLQFEHLKKHKGSLQNEEELFSKTGELLEEAYQEVRSMAHVKNNGVIAKKGLLPAIEKLAKSVSVSNQLKVEVQDFGLTERIDNSLEITIFRIIQELVTNIIKHAEATEASISLTQLEDTINIIVEDNGKGFNARKTLNKEKGMGLSSIEKRVEHLEGSMEVDATPGKGTNILIDIPI